MTTAQPPAVDPTTGFPTVEAYLASLPDDAARNAYEAVRNKALQNLASARLMARDKAPYFRPLLLTLVPREAPGMGTIATTRTAIMSYDPAVVATWSVKELAGGFIHEVMHLWLEHFKRVGARDPEKFNRAGDRAINPGIFDIGLSLPTTHCLMPKDIGLGDGLTADEYYAKEPDEPPQGGKGLGKGGCGSCAGNKPAPGEAAPDDKEGRTEGAIKRAATQASEEMLEHADKQAGKLPAGWKRIAEASLAPPKVNWRKELGYLIRNAVAFRPGGIVHRYDGMSRRQAGLGFGDNVPILPRLREPICHVAMVIDTSGSMGEREMGEFLREANGVIKSVGARVTFAVCDAEMHGLAEVRTIQEMGKMLKGGGGTDFVPAFEALEKRRPKPDVIIYGTDGYGRAPAQAPRGIETIWALIGPQTVTPAPWGKVIKVDSASAHEAGYDDD